eukprot:Em0008g1070a
MDRDRADKHQREKARDVRIRERSPRGVKRSRSPKPENSRSPRPTEKSRSPGTSDTRPTEKFRSPRSSEKRSRSPKPSDRTSRVSDTRARASRDDARSHRRVDYHSPRPADSHRDRRPHHRTHRESGHRPVQPKEKEAGKPEGASLAPSLPAKLEVDSSSDSEKEQSKPDSIKIEDLIKEIEEGPTSGDESGSGSDGDEDGVREAAVSGNGEGTSSDGESREAEEEGVVSDVTDEQGNGSKRSGTASTEKAVEEEEGEEKPLSPAGDAESRMVEQRSRSKFDDLSDEEEGEEGRRGEWDSLQEQAAGEETGKSEGEDVKEVVVVEPEEEEEDEPRSALPCYYPGLMGCRNVESFEWLNRIEEGTYGVVYRARERTTGEIVALKKLKMEREKEGFPITSLREIDTLLNAHHPNIVHVREIVVGNNMDKIYIVMDYVEHDLKALMETMKQPFLEGEVKTLMVQLLRATSNLLLSHKGILKVGDFGLAREYGSPLRAYTPVVVTLWYRAPELLLGSKMYSTPIDLWSVGCIFAELLLHKPLFKGKSEIDQLNQIFKELGTPNDEIWPGYSQLPGVQKITFAKQPFNNLRKRFPYLTSNGFDLLNRFLTYDPNKRITGEGGLEHAYFKESPLPIDPSMFPTWPAKSEMSKKPTRERSPTAPEGGAFLLNNHDEEEDGFKITSAQVGQAAVGAGFSLRF